MKNGELYDGDTFNQLWPVEEPLSRRGMWEVVLVTLVDVFLHEAFHFRRTLDDAGTTGLRHGLSILVSGRQCVPTSVRTSTRIVRIGTL